jgi:hypothetical protein
MNVFSIENVRVSGNRVHIESRLTLSSLSDDPMLHAMMRVVGDVVHIELTGVPLYHVAHPDIRCLCISKPVDGLVDVVFDLPVKFSGNPDAGKTQFWTCSEILLRPTSEAARALHDPAHNLR